MADRVSERLDQTGELGAVPVISLPGIRSSRFVTCVPGQVIAALACLASGSALFANRGPRSASADLGPAVYQQAAGDDCAWRAGTRRIVTHHGCLDEASGPCEQFGQRPAQ